MGNQNWSSPSRILSAQVREVCRFGTCQEPHCLDSSNPAQEGFWFRNFLRFLRDTDLDWCYWPLNGTQLSGHTRKFGELESYGVLNRAYDGAASAEMLRLLQSVQRAAGAKERLP